MDLRNYAKEKMQRYYNRKRTIILLQLLINYGNTITMKNNLIQALH